MSRLHHVVRRGALALAIVLVATALAGTGTAAGSAPTRHRAASAAAAPDSTVLRINVRSCERCEITLMSFLSGSGEDGWSAGPHTVLHGSVAFVVPTVRTTGLSIIVHTPWEGATGFATVVAMRYKGLQPGERIGFNKARTKTRASACWAGTAEPKATLRIKVRRVNLQGANGKIPGNIAWTPVTQYWLPPMLRAFGGIVGTQDVIMCRAVG